MKILIWFLCIFAFAVVETTARNVGIILGAIPTVLIAGLFFSMARYLCKQYDDRKAEKKNKKAILKETSIRQNKLCDLILSANSEIRKQMVEDGAASKIIKGKLSALPMIGVQYFVLDYFLGLEDEEAQSIASLVFEKFVKPDDSEDVLDEAERIIYTSYDFVKDRVMSSLSPEEETNPLPYISTAVFDIYEIEHDAVVGICIAEELCQFVIDAGEIYK